ncbi:MAG: hypothetical protein V7L31_24570 [Nostoc sp.]
MWADKESILSLNGKTCTCIKPRVQPLETVICCRAGLVMYGLIAVIH